MITNRSLMDQIWVDLNSPTKEEIDSLILTQNINPTAAKDLLSPTPSQYIKDMGAMIYIVMHIPTFKRSQTAEGFQEVDFIIGADNLITARYDSIDALHFFAKQMEVNETLHKNDESHLFLGVMREIYKAIDDELAFIEDWAKEIEKKIFSGHEKDMVFALSDVSRNLLNFKRVIEPHDDILRSLENMGREKFGEKFGAEVKNLVDDWDRVIKRISNQVDLVNELRETNNSMLSTKQNEIMKTLAAIGLILLPLTLIGQIFGLSIRTFPLMNNPNAFWIILITMAFVAMLALIFVKIKKWM